MKNRKNYLKYRKNQFKWKLIGWHSESVCAKCGEQAVYHIYKYDAWCCVSCNEWFDKACSDPNCPFCSKRPETPYEAYLLLADAKMNDAGKRKRWRCDNYQHKTDGMRRHENRKKYLQNQP